MRVLLFTAVLAASVVGAPPAKGSTHSGSYTSSHPTAPAVARDTHGRIARSEQAKVEFKEGAPLPVAAAICSAGCRCSLSARNRRTRPAIDKTSVHASANHSCWSEFKLIDADLALRRT